jgi:metallo-beta-lactamase class B
VRAVRLPFLAATLMAATASLWAQQTPALYSPEWYQQFRGAYSAPMEPFRILANIHYVGAVNIASYLITTPEGHILIDTGTTTMHQGIVSNVTKLGFKPSDIKIMLSGHAHFDHIEGHAAMKALTGARVMAMKGDAEALERGVDTSALGAVGWAPVRVDRVLQDGDTVTLGGTTLRAVLSAGHTQGATTWFTSVEDRGRRYMVAFFGANLPNDGVQLLGNPRHKTVIEDTRRTLARFKAAPPPDIQLNGHPQRLFEGKIERIKAGEMPHPLMNAAEWTAQIANAEANFEKRVEQERRAAGR